MLCVFVYASSEVIVETRAADYQQREGQGNNSIIVGVSYSRDLANDITINFFPVTYDRYLNVLGLDLPPGFPPRPVGSEFDAYKQLFFCGCCREILSMFCYS